MNNSQGSGLLSAYIGYKSGKGVGKGVGSIILLVIRLYILVALIAFLAIRWVCKKIYKRFQNKV